MFFFVTKEGLVPELDLYIPLEFWFCKNPGLALPLDDLDDPRVLIAVDVSVATDISAANEAIL